jgi:hypothetical protein
MLKKFDMVNAKPIAKPINTPMPTNGILISMRKGKPSITRYIIP